MSARRAYRSDLSDARWALIEPTLTAWRAARAGPGTMARVHDLREIVNAILYVCRTGIAWAYLPHDLPRYFSRRQPTTIGRRPLGLTRARILWSSECLAGPEPGARQTLTTLRISWKIFRIPRDRGLGSGQLGSGARRGDARGLLQTARLGVVVTRTSGYCEWSPGLGGRT